MPKLETCIVVNGKLYCWDELRQIPVEAEIVVKETFERIPDNILKLLLKKIM